MFKKWLREIDKVGLKDWLWFVAYLGRNKFSHRLDVRHGHNDKFKKLNRDRKRAHDIDHALLVLNNPYRCSRCNGGLAYVNAPCYRCVAENDKRGDK